MDDLIQSLRRILPEDSVCMDTSYRTGVCAWARVPVERLRDAAVLFRDGGFYLEAITGLDFKDTAELVYHMNRYEPCSRIALRVFCNLDGSVPSICDIFPAAQWHEREVHDFFGIGFEGNPDVRPLLLPEDADYHPLQKGFGKVNAHRNRKEIYG